MKQFNIVHQGRILACIPAIDSADALKRFRDMQRSQLDQKIRHAEEMVEFLKRQRQWDAEHPMDLAAYDLS
jgi:hypothetical protein